MMEQVSQIPREEKEALKVYEIPVHTSVCTWLK